MSGEKSMPPMSGNAARIGRRAEGKLEKVDEEVAQMRFHGAAVRPSQALDLLGDVGDVDAVGTQVLGPGAQLGALVLGPGVEVLVVEAGCLGCHRRSQSSIASGSST